MYEKSTFKGRGSHLGVYYKYNSLMGVKMVQNVPLLVRRYNLVYPQLVEEQVYSKRTHHDRFEHFEKYVSHICSGLNGAYIHHRCLKAHFLKNHRNFVG